MSVRLGKHRSHVFTGFKTGEVYDESQTNDDIKSGDVLVVPKCGVVGFMIEAWPIAVTKYFGSFHKRDPKYTWDTMPYPQDGRDYKAIAAFAIATAKELGYPVNE